ncbi:MAG: hypothetical protein HMLIMOIP_002061 [Candidatus Nitrosomirales archaeon]|jgi:hypothetical protein
MKKFTKLYTASDTLEKIIASAYFQIDKHESRHFSIVFKPADTSVEGVLVVTMYDVNNEVRSVRCNENKHDLCEHNGVGMASSDRGNTTQDCDCPCHKK